MDEYKLNSIISEFMILNINNYMRNNSFYTELYDTLYDTSKKHDIKYENVYDQFTKYLNKWHSTLLAASYTTYGKEQTENLQFLFSLISYPIENKLKIKNKKYSDFNINIQFFNDLYINNAKIVEEEQSDENIYKLYSFEFNKHNKLNSFIIYNNTGIKWVYNKDYNIKTIIFADGNKMNVKINN